MVCHVIRPTEQVGVGKGPGPYPLNQVAKESARNVTNKLETLPVS